MTMLNRSTSKAPASIAFTDTHCRLLDRLISDTKNNRSDKKSLLLHYKGCTSSSPWQKRSDCPKLTYKSFRIDPDYSATGVLPRAARASVAVGNGRHGLHSISELLQDPNLRSEFGWNFVL